MRSKNPKTMVHYSRRRQKGKRKENQELLFTKIIRIEVISCLVVGKVILLCCLPIHPSILSTIHNYSRTKNDCRYVQQHNKFKMWLVRSASFSGVSMFLCCSFLLLFHLIHCALPSVSLCFLLLLPSCLLPSFFLFLCV